MKTNSHLDNAVQPLDLEQLATVSGGGNAPLGGNVRQNINTNWGGSQTNINTQIINQAPKPTNSIVEYLRTNPAARLEMMRRPSPVGRF